MGFHLVDDLGVCLEGVCVKDPLVVYKEVEVADHQKDMLFEGFPHEVLFLVVLSFEQVGKDVEARKWTLKETARRRGELWT